MAVIFRPLERAEKEYSFETEDKFRKSLEAYLVNLSVETNGAVSRRSAAASLASKRESLLVPTIGLTTY